MLLLEALLDLVDMHWNGRGSLHSSEVFLGELAQGSAGWRLCPLLGPGPLALLAPSLASLPSGLWWCPEGPAQGIWVSGGADEEAPVASGCCSAPAGAQLPGRHRQPAMLAPSSGSLELLLSACRPHPLLGVNRPDKVISMAYMSLF